MSLTRLQPDIHVKSIYDINFDMLRQMSISCLILDIDNTLTPWNSTEISDELSNWIQSALNNGFKICLLSNNGEKRVRELADKLAVDYIFNAAKPRRHSYNLALKKMNEERQHAAVIGDQILTDILGGKRAGMFTILVDPIGESEFIGTKIMRFIERLFFDRNSYKKGEMRQ